ncbi:hypothetical protein GCM10007416_35640 [Kroppenstedtia guangzhouensis]|uniref:Uncharacterized protein n=1 Tax=Kroppenstedtia guangzhouensis TaxID=1274356 RepID=A0ABQ1H5F6_9BACL|nr:hypothetical protein [Kroppenstedtia guangzhouensis]GGA59448.1 hypothetical protein GCM10007416_35640 [Kroppenstedtia guangzhouensis]
MKKVIEKVEGTYIRVESDWMKEKAEDSYFKAHIYCGFCNTEDYERISHPDDPVSPCSCGSGRDVIVVFDEEGDPV